MGDVRQLIKPLFTVKNKRKRESKRMRNMSIRKIVLVFIDLITLCLACFASFFLSNTMAIVHLTVSDTYWSLILFTLCNSLSLTLCGTYRSIWRYAEVKNFLLVISSLFLGTLDQTTVGEDIIIQI